MWEGQWWVKRTVSVAPKYRAYENTMAFCVLCSTAEASDNRNRSVHNL